jgi:hypothetical protein
VYYLAQSKQIFREKIHQMRLCKFECMDVVTGGRKCPINSNKHNMQLVFGVKIQEIGGFKIFTNFKFYMSNILGSKLVYELFPDYNIFHVDFLTSKSQLKEFMFVHKTLATRMQ